MQLTGYARAANQATFPRYNKIWTVSFTVVRKFDDEAISEAFTINHARELADYGTLNIYGVGSSTLQQRAPDAVLASYDAQMKGYTVICSYVFAAGYFLFGPP